MQVPKKRLNDGSHIPVLGLGTWQMEKKTCLTAVLEAYQLGYRHIDTAFAYYNESAIGEVMQHFPREEIFLTSKLWREFHLKPEECLDKSLKDLKTSYLDLYLIHWPERKNMIDVLSALHKMREKGKIKSIGVSNATVSHLKEILRQKVPISVNQVEFHPYLNQEELLKFCQEENIQVTAYCPIAQGEVLKDPVIAEIGKNHGKTAVQVVLKWLIQKGLVAIPKGSALKHLKENIEIFDFMLSDIERQEIDKLNQGKRIVFPEFNEF